MLWCNAHPLRVGRSYWFTSYGRSDGMSFPKSNHAKHVACIPGVLCLLLRSPMLDEAAAMLREQPVKKLTWVMKYWGLSPIAWEKRKFAHSHVSVLVEDPSALVKLRWLEPQPTSWLPTGGRPKNLNYPPLCCPLNSWVTETEVIKVCCLSCSVLE